MGDANVNVQLNERNRLIYINHLLDDLKSLEYMLERDMIESGITRLGAEQEFCLIDNCWRPATNAKEILDSVDDDHFTSELARYNLEINLDPVEAGGDSFQKLRFQLESLLNRAHQTAAAKGSKVVLSGILPSISMNEIGLDHMTAEPRYQALNDVLVARRGGDFKLRLNGVDELALAHNTMMFEACNTSFQMHLQIDPHDFESAYNWSQAISGPVLSVCVNSPLLLGKELWSETRIALFQQSIDTRKFSRADINRQARVSFGNNWVRGSILDHYKSEISRFPIILTKEIEQNSYEELMQGKIPKLQALNLHNGTVYRWNRPCYGLGNGKPHLRIENRYIPSGPSIEDEIANMMFWVGLMAGRPKAYEQIWNRMDFKDAKCNFVRAAKHGSEAVLSWDGNKHLASDLIVEVFIPICRDGLTKMKIDEADINHYLSVIEKRLETNTASQWVISNYRALKEHHSQDHALLTITKGIYDNQMTGKPISAWPKIEDEHHPENYASHVSHIMSSKLINVNHADSARLTLEFMRWNNIHHLPVVDDQSNLVGLVTWSHLEQFQDKIEDPTAMLCVKDVMVKEVQTVEINTPIDEAIQLAREYKLGCLPVMQNDKLVGIVTNRDLNRLEHAQSI